MLTDAQCKNATCPPEKVRARFSDSGALYLEVGQNGSKRWFWKYRKEGKEGRMALGSYPAVSLNGARRARDAAKLKKSDGIDPVQARKIEKLKSINPAGESFKIVALEWYEKQAPSWSDSHGTRAKRQLERDLFPWLGDRRMADIEPVELLATLRKIEARGAFETANRELMLASLVWRYGVATGRVTRDITVDLKGALTPYRGKHFAAITDPSKLGELILATRAYKGGVVVRAALQLAPILFQRPVELRAAKWDEFDLDAGLWTIPAARMKRGKDGKENGDPHLVPLPRQAIEILRRLRPYTESTGLVFPGERSRDRPISDNSVRTALISLGYTSEIQTWHGFRATARTMLAERLEVDIQVIEAQLAHSVNDANGRAYNRTTFIKQRLEMMQRWADYLDHLSTLADASNNHTPAMVPVSTDF
jgi:integrase